MQENIFSLTAASDTEAFCFHIFSSASFKYLRVFRIYGNEFIRALRKVKVITRNKFLKADIKKLWHKNAIILPPTIDYNLYIAKKRNPKYITFINYSPIKGAIIFYNIARKLLAKKFLVIDRYGLFKNKLRNVKVLSKVLDMKNIYKVTKILLVPSLIEEGDCRVIHEAIVNKIPVIANNVKPLKYIWKKGVFFINIDKKNYNKKDFFFNPLYHIKTYEKYIKLINRLDSDKNFYNKACREARRQLKKVKTYQLKQTTKFIRMIKNL
ncbi:MAG: hypothetical protein NC935_06330 [Candidatus Omnitrophica bacterium]|nr:hypothetical protein [Candidatus Omnitrophota bacterium]